MATDPKVPWRIHAQAALEYMGIDPADVLEDGFSPDGYYRIIRDGSGKAVVISDGCVDREWVFFSPEQHEVLRKRDVF